MIYSERSGLWSVTTAEPTEPPAAYSGSYVLRLAPATSGSLNISRISRNGSGEQTTARSGAKFWFARPSGSYTFPTGNDDLITMTVRRNSGAYLTVLLRRVSYVAGDDFITLEAVESIYAIIGAVFTVPVATWVRLALDLAGEVLRVYRDDEVVATSAGPTTLRYHAPGGTPIGRYEGWSGAPPAYATQGIWIDQAEYDPGSGVEVEDFEIGFGSWNQDYTVTRVMP